MNNKTVLLVVVSMFVTACAMAMDPDVPKFHREYGCDQQNLNLLLDVNKIQLVPKKVKCVEKNTEYTMKITVLGNDLTISAGDVTIKPKPGNPAWLNGTNSPDEKELKFTVGEDAVLNTDYSYIIEVKGVGNLDPIVKVVGEL